MKDVSEKLSTNVMLNIVVVERCVCPYSRTSTASHCRFASLSDTARAVRTSLLCKPIAEQLVRQPRILPRFRVHRHHVGNQVARLLSRLKCSATGTLVFSSRT